MSNTRSGAVASARLAVTTALLDGDPGGAFHMVSGLMDQGVPFDVVLFDVVAAAHADFGTRWQHGDYRIADEHAATGAVEALVGMLAGSFDLPEAGDQVVVAAAEGDHHSIPSRLTAAYLLALGYRVRYLGSNMEATDLAGYLADESPKALILSCAMPTLLRGARASIRAAHEAGVPVLAGGNGFGAGGLWAYSIGADAWVASPREVHDVLTAWEPGIETAELAVPETPAELGLIDHRRQELLARSMVHLDESSRRLREELELLLAAVEAALLVDDPMLVSQFTAWQAALLSSHGFADEIPAGLRRALSAGLSDIAPAAARLLTD
jgi:methanogenic corrinoid protein MtbC1